MQKRGKLCAIEGTDASGKNTQTIKLCDRLNATNILCARDTFPRYNSPTGKIVGGPVLGKSEICPSFFLNGAGNIPASVASLYYAADRLFNLPVLESLLRTNDILVLDRYVESNMGHQGGKIRNPEERLNFFKKLENLEYGWCGLPRPDFTIFLYMPFQKGIELKSQMGVQKDEVEKDEVYLRNSEESFLQLAKLYNWKQINCVENNNLRTKEDIHEEVYNFVKQQLEQKALI